LGEGWGEGSRVGAPICNPSSPALLPKGEGRINPKTTPLGRFEHTDNIGCYFPAKIIQSPCDVAINKSIGSESQALVREPTKA
jgi:hypothetical protein